MRSNKLAVLWFWFGRFPPHSRLLFRSVARNSSINVLLFTDNSESAGGTPPNIFLHNTTLHALEKRIRQSFHPTAKLAFPYKICDYRPVFGELFAKELEPYEFWGWGDLDVVWGNLTDFFPDRALQSYSKIFQFGALSFVRNSAEMNSLFRRPGGLEWLDVMQSDAFRGFDETQGIFAKIEHAGLRAYYDNCRADIVPYKPWFTEKVHRSVNACLYAWINGNLYRECWINNSIMQAPISYVHFQKREMPIFKPDFTLERNCFWITPNGIVDRPQSPTKSDIYKASMIRISTLSRFTRYWMWRALARLRGTGVRKSVG